MNRTIFVLCMALSSLSWAGDTLQFHCIRRPLDLIMHFEAGYKDCGPADEPKSARLLKKESVCMEWAGCAAVTPEFKKEIESVIPADLNVTYDDLTKEEVTDYLAKVMANPTKRSLLKNSALTCHATSGTCPDVNKCMQEDFYYNLSGMNQLEGYTPARFPDTTAPAGRGK